MVHRDEPLLVIPTVRKSFTCTACKKTPNQNT